jgi:hypothetical protein
MIIVLNVMVLFAAEIRYILLHVFNPVMLECVLHSSRFVENSYFEVRRRKKRDGTEGEVDICNSKTHTLCQTTK